MITLEALRGKYKKEREDFQLVLKGAGLRLALEKASSDSGMDPALVEKFLQFEEPELPVNITKVVSILLVLHIASLTLVNLGVGAQFDPSLQLPSLVHQAFQAIHNLSVNAAESASLRHHFPFLLLETGVLLGGGAISEKIKNYRKSVKMALKIKSALEGQANRGEINFQMPSGHTAVFSGKGDAYATWLQQELGRENVMTYTSDPLGENTLTKQGYILSSTRDTLTEALERGDFVSAGEIVLLPVTAEDQFLPDPDEENGGFDMSLSDMDVLLAKMEAYLKRSQIHEKKKVIIVSSRQQQEAQAIGRDRTEMIRTLKQLKDEENRKRKHLEIDIVDPTELVFEKLMTLLSGNEPELITIKKSGDRYSERFYREFDIRSLQKPSNGEKMRVFYNISDIDTVAAARPDDIAIVSTERHRQALIDDGLDPGRIIVISQLVKDRIEELVTANDSV